MYEGGHNNRIIPNSIIQHRNHENESMSLWHCKTDNGGICYLVDFNYGPCFVVLYLTGVPATVSNFNIRAWSIKVQFYLAKVSELLSKSNLWEEEGGEETPKWTEVWQQFNSQLQWTTTSKLNSKCYLLITICKRKMTHWVLCGVSETTAVKAFAADRYL